MDEGYKLKFFKMEYRIKIIQKHLRENLFIPQYRKDDWGLALMRKIFWYPFLFIFWLLFPEKKEWKDIPEYFDMWNSIEYDKTTFKEIHTFFCWDDENAICDNKENAEYIIKVHKQDLEDKLKKEQKEKMNQVKKILYIKYE